MQCMNRTISDLPNLGPKCAEWLEAVGITTEEDLRAVGIIEAYKRCQDAGVNTTLNLLWAMFGALNNIPFEEVPKDIKEQLKQQL